MMSTLLARLPLLRSLRSLWVLAVLVGSSGCDFILDGPSYSGVVLDAETGEPVEGIQISLQGGGGVGLSVVAEDFTDSEGRFNVQNPTRGGSRLPLYYNSPGNDTREGVYNPDYDSGPVDYEFEDRHDIVIEIERSDTFET